MPARTQDSVNAPHLLTVADAAARLSVAPRTVRAWMQDWRRSAGLRGIQSISLSARCVRIPEPALAKWIASRGEA
jgi:hypothetical protein